MPNDKQHEKQKPQQQYKTESNIRNPKPSLSDAALDVLHDLPPDKQIMHVINMLVRQKGKTEDALQDLSNGIREMSSRFGEGIDTATKSLAMMEQRYHGLVKDMEESNVRVAEIYKEHSARLSGIEKGLVELARLEGVETSIRALNDKISLLEKDVALSKGEAAVTHKLAWQILLWGGGVTLLALNFLFQIFKK